MPANVFPPLNRETGWQKSELAATKDMLLIICWSTGPSGGKPRRRSSLIPLARTPIAGSRVTLSQIGTLSVGKHFRVDQRNFFNKLHLEDSHGLPVGVIGTWSFFEVLIVERFCDNVKKSRNLPIVADRRELLVRDTYASWPVRKRFCELPERSNPATR